MNLLRFARGRPVLFWTMVATLALGVGANTAVLAVVRSVLIDPQPYVEPDRVVVFVPTEHFGNVRLTAADASVLASLSSLTSVGGCSLPSSPIIGDRASVLAATVEVSRAFFDVFRVPPLLGRLLVAADFRPAEPVAVLSHELWWTVFAADPEIVGRTVTLGGTRVVVVGVMPRTFQVRCWDVDGPVAWVPHDPSRVSVATQTGLMLFARLAPTVTLEAADAERAALARARLTSYGDDRLAQFLLEPAHAARARALRAGLILLQAVAFVLFAVACANLAGAFLLSVSERQQELGMRVALGATPWQVARLVVGETSVVAATGALAGAAIARTMLAPFESLAAPVLRGLVLTPGWRDVAASLAIGGAGLVLFGTITAVATAHWARARSSGSRGADRSSHRLRVSILATHVCLTTVLLIGGALLLRSYWNAISSPTGFEPGGVVTTDVHLPFELSAERRSVAFQRTLAALRADFGQVLRADAVAFSDQSAFVSGGSWRAEILLPDVARAERRSLNVKHVSPNYFDVMGIPLLRGRAFTSDRGGVVEAVVSEGFARLFDVDVDGVMNALIRLPSRDLRVVGVVGDVKTTWMTVEPRPAVYAPIQFASSRLVSVVVRAPNPVAVTPTIREAIERASPDAPLVAIEPLETIVWRSEATRRFYLTVTGAFAIIAVLVSALGIFSTVAHVVALHSRDLAVRVALGADWRHVTTSVLFEGLGPVALGIVSGVAGGFVLARVLASNSDLRSLLFQVSTTDPVAYVGAVFLMFVTALLACVAPLRRALLVDPATTLRDE